MNRRQLLAFFGVLGSGTISGCIGSISGQRNNSKICSIRFLNKHTESIETTTKITTENSSNTITENHRVGKSDDDSGEMYSIPKSNLPSSPGEYRIEINISGDDWNIEDDIHTTELEPDNLSLVWAVSDPAEDGTSPTHQLLTNQDGRKC